jgi:hypothetical protein
MRKQFRTEPELEMQEVNRRDVKGLKPYLLHLKKKELGGWYCEECWDEGPSLDLHHKRYAMDVTVDDLQVLCEPCHGKKRGKTVVELPAQNDA